jgi:hypothetical protein
MNRTDAIQALAGPLDLNVGFALGNALVDELPDAEFLIVHAAGKDCVLELALKPVLVFYSVRADESSVLVVTESVPAPRGARVHEERVPKAEAVKGTFWLETTLLVAEHEDLPGGRIELDLPHLEAESVERVRELFRSWAEPAYR